MNLIIPTITITIILSITLTIILPQTHINEIKNKLILIFLISLAPLNSSLNHKELTLSSVPLILTPTENINISFTLDTLPLIFIPVTLFIT
uniref:NADH dehydrogenase subunit 5 n=1 Tax=Micrurus fulvius TaxID=8637 RepID=U3F7G8_MICFL